jgi:hypothetical protein
MDSGEMDITKPMWNHITDSENEHGGFDRKYLPFLVMRS